MAQATTSTKVTSEQYHISQLIAKLEQKYTKEFAITPYDGLLVVINKKAFSKTTAIDSLTYELTSFNGSSGTGLLQYMTPGSVIPLFPSTVKAEHREVEVVTGHRFLDRVFILSGAEHVDKTQHLIPNVHKYDEVISSMAQKTRATERDQEFNSFGNNVGADVLDATSEDALESSYVNDLFDNFFPQIAKDDRHDYVMYVACHAKAAIDYVLSNLDVLNKSVLLSDQEKRSSLLVSPTTMRIVIDNQRLCLDAPAFCRMLVCHDNEVMLKPEDVNKYYGTSLYVSDPTLTMFNATLKHGMTFNEKNCSKLPECKYLVSMMASVVLYEHPIPVQLFLENATSTEALVERMYAILYLYLKNKQLTTTKMGIADQLACMSLGILHNSGISPEYLKIYRNDEIDIEQNEKKNPWPATYQQQIKENVKRILANKNNDQNDVQKIDVQLKEVMDSSVFHLLTLINYRDHVFNADVFKNASELYNDSIKKNSERHFEKPSEELNQIKIKPLCSRSVFGGELSIVQNIFARFHYNPVAFKRFFVLNALYYLDNETPSMDDSIESIPFPDDIEVIYGKGYVKDLAEYRCTTCGNVPFYEKGRSHCLCFLLLKVVAALMGIKMNSLTSLKSVYDSYVQNMPRGVDYNGKMTSYKALHNIVVNEVQSSCSYFGKIQLKHAGKSNGFGTRRKTNNYEAAEGDATSSGKQAAAGETKEYSEHEKEMSAYLETRKLEWVVKSVKRELKRLATLADPNVSENGETKNSPLWSFQRLWLPDGETSGFETEDLRCFVTGTKDDPVDTCRNAMLNSSETIFPLLITDQTVVSKSVGAQFNYNSQAGKIIRNNACDWENVTDDDNEVAVKKPKLDYRAIAAKNMKSLIYSVFYKLLNDNQCGLVTIDQINHQHRDLIAKWNEKPQKYKSLFKETMLKMVLGENHNTQNLVDINDPCSLVARVVKTYLERLPTFFLNVHNAVAKVLGITPQELDEDFSKIVHHNEKTKREFVSWHDIRGTDTLNKRSTMLTLFEVIRHEVEARDVKGASETRSVTKANADHILRNDTGPYCKTAAGNVQVHVPIIKADDSDGISVLSISDNSATNAPVTFDMSLPIKMKVSLNVAQMDENKDKKIKTEGNREDEDDEPYDSEDRSRFVPRPLLNDAKTSKVPVMANTPRPAHELIEILTDERLHFSDAGSVQFADLTKNAATVEILCHYIRDRTNGKKVFRTHNLVMHGFFTMINRALEQLLLLLNKTVLFLSSIVSGLNESELRVTSEQLQKDLICMKILECAIHAVCSCNPRLTSPLYLLALCSELYGPPCIARDSSIELERDNHALNAAVAGCLRLFVGSDDCNKIHRKEDSRQVRLVPVLWTYLKSREKPVMTMTDVSRCLASQMMLTLQPGSYTSSYSKSSVFTSVRGGAPLTKVIAPVMNSIVRTQIIEGEYNHIVCRPLVWVSNKFAERGKESISTVVETYPLQVFVRYVLENPSTIPALLDYYTKFFPKAKEDCSENDLWEACEKAHRIQANDEDVELFKSVVLPKMYDMVTGRTPQKCEEEDDEYAWTDSDE